MKQILLLMILCITFQGSYAQDIGSKAPDFTLPSTTDDDHTLSMYEGKVVVVFMLGYGCPSCKGIAPSVQTQLVDVYQDNENVVFLGIDVWDGTKAQVQDFSKSTNTTFTILQKGSQVAKDWQTSYDRLVIIDQYGNMAFKGSGLVSSHLERAIVALEEVLETQLTSVENLQTDKVNLEIYPNPAQAYTQLRFNLDEEQFVSGNIYDISGRKLQSIEAGKFNVGINTIEIDVSNLSNGLKFLQLQIGNQFKIQKFNIE